FSAMQSFNQAIPADEQLRVLAKSPAGQPLPVAASAQTEMHLKQLIARYSEIKQKASSK
nr:ImpA domain-containing protein [Enterobacter cloacae]